MYIHSEKCNLHSFYQREEGEKGEARDGEFFDKKLELQMQSQQQYKNQLRKNR